ncbi:MAG TPA: putative toxin-antitoxin system toxin component, PIN family [Candidatus Saccharibacteria bacterium]|nr:putative toxin-antitoxin system toxin component, PIN family [Candidatus Saccharibacteria bacterium]
MSRVVIDTSAAITLLANRRGIWFLKNSFSLEHQIILSSYLINELERILKTKLKLSKSKVKSISSFYKSLAIIAEVKEIKKLTRDHSDDPILSLALEQKVDYLITLDQDFLSLEQTGKLKIIKPEEMIDL